MSETLARIFALQQREINENERHRQLALAKRTREITAFMNSGLPALFIECSAVPLSKDSQQRLYKKVFAECTWDHCDARKKQVSEMSFSQLGGSSSSNPRWWCTEDKDSGRMLYMYSATGSYSNCEVRSNEPTGPWLDAFIEYIAKVCDPQAIADKLSESQANQARETHFNRRQLQPV
jgi:hypothetical protein